MKECNECLDLEEVDFPDGSPLIGTTYCRNREVRTKVSELLGEPIPDHADPACKLVYEAYGGVCPCYNKP